VDALLFEIRELLVRRTSAGATFELLVPSLSIGRGEKLAVVGPSGCGKSTLLDCLSMIVRPESVAAFRFRAGGEPSSEVDVASLLWNDDGAGLAELRKRWIGYVLQTGGLLPYLSVRRNIEINRKLLGLPDDGTVEAVAERLGIARHLRKLPSALSVGERQRTAIARALAHHPAAIIADEPTAALDPRNAEIVMNAFVELAERFGVTLVVASHDVDRVRSFGLRLVEPSVASNGEGVVRSTLVG
jgi:putative ABC transport system ATP-binding protein